VSTKNKQLNAHLFRVLKSAVRSLSTSTTVEVKYDKFIAKVWGRRSPYLTHQGVAHQIAQEPICGLRVTNSNFELVISRDIESSALKALIWENQGFSYKADWKLCVVPRPVVDPVISEAEKWLGFKLDLCGDLLAVAVLDRIVGGWWQKRPLFELAVLPDLDGPSFKMAGLEWRRVKNPQWPFDSGTMNKIAGVKIVYDPDLATSSMEVAEWPPIGVWEGHIVWAYHAVRPFFVEGGNWVEPGGYIVRRI
jgi:hypothetical protein